MGPFKKNSYSLVFWRSVEFFWIIHRARLESRTKYKDMYNLKSFEALECDVRKHGVL